MLVAAAFKVCSVRPAVKPVADGSEGHPHPARWAIPVPQPHDVDGSGGTGVQPVRHEVGEGLCVDHCHFHPGVVAEVHEPGAGLGAGKLHVHNGICRWQVGVHVGQVRVSMAQRCIQRMHGGLQGDVQEASDLKQLPAVRSGAWYRPRTRIRGRRS